MNIGAALRTGLLMTIALTILTGVIYPFAMMGIGQVLFPFQANGSLLRNAQGVVVGSELIAQGFTSPKYFHPRPSSAGAGYDGTSSSGSNLGPTSAKFLDSVKDLTEAYRAENGLAANVAVPVDAVTGSGSGLDPDISPANAALQVRRVASARSVTPTAVQALVDQNTEGRFLSFIGEPRVNVLKLNLALDATGR